MIGRTAALLALLPSLALAAGELHLPPITRVTLENGMRLVVAEDHELPTVQLTLFVGAGAAQDPPDRLGLAEMVADALLRGAGPYDAQELARAIEDLGGRIDAEPGFDATIVSADFLSDDFEAGLALLRAVLREPRFEKDEVRRSRDELLADLKSDLEDPSKIANRCFAAWLYGSYPYGRPQKGTPETVEEIGAREVRRFHDRWYRPNNTILALVGDVTAERALAALRQAFTDWKAEPDAVPQRSGPPTPLAARRVLLVDKPDATQSQIRTGGIAMARNDPDLLTAQVANTALGGGFSSLLIEELRVKRSLTYSAYSGYVPRLLGGDFRMSTFSKTATSVETLTLGLDVLARFRSQPIDPKVLTKAKAYVAGQFALQLETAGALAQRLAEIEFFGLPRDELVTYRSRVAAVDVAAASRAVTEHQPPTDRMAIVVVGPAATLRAPLEAALGPVTVVRPDECDRLPAP